MDRRDIKKELIIEKACAVFLTKGFFNVVMDDIAESAGLTRRSLYRYFETKEELAYETTLLLLEQWNRFIKETYLELEGSGLECLDSFLNRLIDYMARKIDTMKYLGEFDFYFQDGRPEKLSGTGNERFDRIVLESDKFLTELLNRGIKDHSIQKDINVTLMVATISHVLWSFGQRIAIRNNQILKETGFSGLEIIKYQICLYISALKEK